MLRRSPSSLVALRACSSRRSSPASRAMSAASSWSSTQFVAGSSSSSAAAAASSGAAARRSTPASTGFTSVRSTSARRAMNASSRRSSSNRMRVRQASARLLEAQVDRDRDAAHVADLEVEHDEIGLDLGDLVAHVLAARDLDHLLARAHERRPNLVAHPLRLGGNQDRRHRSGSLEGGSSVSSNRKSADLAQRGEVVDVAGEIRHVGDRRRSDPLVHASQVLTFDLGDLAEVGEVLVALGQATGGLTRRRRRRFPSFRSSAAARRPAGASSPNIGCTRFTISASICLAAPFELAREELRLFERVAARRRHEHERGVGRGEELLDREGARRGTRLPSLRTRGRTRRRRRSPRIRRPSRRSAGTSARRRSRP